MMEDEVIAISDAESSTSVVLVATNKPSHITESKQNTSTSSYCTSSEKLENGAINYLKAQGPSPSPRAKVNDWLLANYRASNVSSQVMPRTPNNSLTFFGGNKSSSILIRQDYSKPKLSTLAVNSSNSDNLEHSKCKVISVSSSVCSSSATSNRKMITLPIKQADVTKTVQTKCSNSCDIPVQNDKECVTDEKSNNSPVKVPNKLELCEYLKLMNMNPNHLRTVGLNRNRRSIRVKNLAIMSKQRALERELNSVSAEEKHSSPDSSVQSVSSKEAADKRLKNIGSISSTYNGDTSIPTLQVPEITTTYVLRASSRSESNSKVGVIPVVKPKGATPLNIHPTEQHEDFSLPSPHSNLLKYLSTIPLSNFDDFYSTYLNDLKPLSNMEKKVKISSIPFSERKYKPKKPKLTINELQYKLRHRLRLGDNVPKSKRPTLERQNSKSKLQRRLKLYVRKRDLMKLRSKGQLREIELKSVLLTHERRRKKIKKKTKPQLPLTELDYAEKEFRCATLIQTAPENTQIITTVSEDRITLSPKKFSPMKLSKLKSDIDLLKNLTPEHRKALFESKKFLTMQPNSIIEVNDASSSFHRSVSNQLVVDNDQGSSKTVQQCDSSNFVQLENVAKLTDEANQSCTEDDEVNILMNHNKTAGEGVAAQHASSLIEEVPFDTKAQCTRETSSSKPSTTTTFETVKDYLRHSNEKLAESCGTSTTHGSDPRLDELSNDSDNQPEVIDISAIQPTRIDPKGFKENHDTKIKSLHQCLTQVRKKVKTNTVCDQNATKYDKKVSQSYAIDLSVRNGAIMNAYYLDYNLVIVQELLISFWTQTPLGNILGAQDMWMPKGDTKRLVLGNACVRQESPDTIMVLDNSIAYFELWTKEHISDRRELPVADIFVTIYLKLMGSAPDKKVLQLENIHGYANDVQYIVIKNLPIVVVSWNTINDQLTSTVIHKYHLSSDYQSVTNITSMHPAIHYISSLQNIEDSDTLIMGCGEDKITLWHLEDGYVVATLDLMAVSQQPRTLWAKADRGFIFTLHIFNDGHFHLIATNSFDYSWKQLQVYKQECNYENLLGICIENGLVIAFYEAGVVCWKAMSGELVLDSSCENSIFLPFGKHLVIITPNEVQVRHVLEYLVTIDEDL